MNQVHFDVFPCQSRHFPWIFISKANGDSRSQQWGFTLATLGNDENAIGD